MYEIINSYIQKIINNKIPNKKEYIKSLIYIINTNQTQKTNHTIIYKYIHNEKKNYDSLKKSKKG